MTAPAVVRRPAEPADREFCFRVYASTRAEELAQVADWDDAQREAFLRQQFEAQDAYYREHYRTAEFMVLEHAGKPVGRLYVDRWPGEIRLMDVALLPGARGRGLGGALLRELQGEARAAGKPLRIHVERFNPALRLYERLGFRVLEDRGVYLFLEWVPAASSE
jgi:ribosomal protein S18 acetylase RimI-like enzyme